MPPIDPRLVIAKRFPVHAAVDLCHEAEVRRLVDNDAGFHLSRKIPVTEQSVVHSACTLRMGPPEVMIAILKYLIKVIKCRRLSMIWIPTDKAHCTTLSVTPWVKIWFPILLDADVNVNSQRNNDLWTPLHLAVMLGKFEVVQVLVLKGGADTEKSDALGKTAKDLAEKYRMSHIADFLDSPRKEYEPPSQSLPPQFSDLITKSHQTNPAVQTPIKIKDDLLQWRDEEDNCLLHIAAWNGDLKLSRSIFESIKGRKLTNAVNRKGASPLAMAIINGQIAMVEEFFMNKHAKKVVDLGIRLKDTGQNIVHLMFSHCSYIHPKIILKRKDLTKDVLNAKDNEGISPLIGCLLKGNASLVTKIIANKNVKEQKLLDFSCKAKSGRNVLHIIIDSKDVNNFRSIIDREELTEEIATELNPEGLKPVMMCYNSSMSDLFMKEILNNPKAAAKLDVNNMDDATKSLCHILLQQENYDLLNFALKLDHVDLNSLDSEGDTIFMKLLKARKLKLLDTYLNQADVLKKLDFKVQNKDGDNLAMLCIKHLEEPFLSNAVKFIPYVDLVKEANKSGNTILHLAAIHSQWEILSNWIQRNHEEEEASQAFDVHKQNRDGHSLMVLTLHARMRLAKLEQTCLIKKEEEILAKASAEKEVVWDVVKMILEKEKLHHGPTIVQGRDEGVTCLKKQMNLSRLLKGAIQDEVTSEYKRMYIKKKTLAPVKIEKKIKEDVKSPDLILNGSIESIDKKLKRQSSLVTSNKLPEGDQNEACNEQGEAKRQGKKKKNESTPISLDALRDPAAFEAMVNNLTKEIDFEKRQAAKKKKKVVSKKEVDPPPALEGNDITMNPVEEDFPRIEMEPSHCIQVEEDQIEGENLEQELVEHSHEPDAATITAELNPDPEERMELELTNTEKDESRLDITKHLKSSSASPSPLEKQDEQPQKKLKKPIWQLGKEFNVGKGGASEIADCADAVNAAGKPVSKDDDDASEIALEECEPISTVLKDASTQTELGFNMKTAEIQTICCCNCHLLPS